jgi:5-methylcytosine-specific restriction endonuclease McrA
MRASSTTRAGQRFSEVTVQAVWNKGRPIPGYHPDVWRRDACGAAINRQAYGNTNSQHGWEVDHIHPVAKGGGDDLANLQPLQWENNRSKGDNYPHWACKVA